MNSDMPTQIISKKEYKAALSIVKEYRLQQKQKPPKPKKVLSEKQLEALRQGRLKNSKLAKLRNSPDTTPDTTHIAQSETDTDHELRLRQMDLSPHGVDSIGHLLTSCGIHIE